MVIYFIFQYFKFIFKILWIYYFIFLRINPYGQNKYPKITIKGTKGDNYYNIFNNLYTKMNKSFILEKDLPDIPQDFILNNIDYNDIVKYFLSLGIKITEKNNRIFIVNKKLYWKTYKFNLLNYEFSMDNDNKKETNIKGYDINYNIKNKNNPWEELEKNIKDLNVEYIINKNSGIIAVKANNVHHKIIDEIWKEINGNHNFYFIIDINFIAIKYIGDNNENPIQINNEFLHILENFIKNRSRRNNKILYENKEIFINTIDTHRLATLNNIPVLFSNQTETIQKNHQETQEFSKFNSIRKNIITYDKFYEGISLYLHPIKNQNKISLYCLPTIRDNVENNKFYTKILSSTLLLKPEETFILGGFMKNHEEISHNNIPWFKKIAIIKYFFTNKNKKIYKEQLIITIKISIH